MRGRAGLRLVRGVARGARVWPEAAPNAPLGPRPASTGCGLTALSTPTTGPPCVFALLMANDVQGLRIYEGDTPSPLWRGNLCPCVRVSVRACASVRAAEPAVRDSPSRALGRSAKEPKSRKRGADGPKAGSRITPATATVIKKIFQGNRIKKKKVHSQKCTNAMKLSIANRNLLWKKIEPLFKGS